ncbi:MAG: ABC transporter ATP-binding protein [Oleibacter sp.]|nr:ABC transporter ATP-binding protein [Thalassolituus sp.]
MSNSNIELSVALSAQGLSKTYRTGPQHVTVWENVSITVRAGESVAIVGASGSGKTSLLNVLGGLDTQDSGTVSVAGKQLHTLNEAERTRLRNQQVGFVYQFHHLLPEFSALENVMMPLLLAGMHKSDASKQAKERLARLKMTPREDHKPSELSGGERQRVAIARAIVANPSLVLMDEPTGNLDQETAAGVEDLMVELRRELDTAFVLVTHDMALARRMERVYQLTDRQLVLSS